MIQDTKFIKMPCENELELWQMHTRSQYIDMANLKNALFLAWHMQKNYISRMAKHMKITLTWSKQ